MYSEWMSHSYEIDTSADSSANNALKSYTPEVGRQVVMAIIQPLMESVNNKEGRSCELNTHEEVKWTMQVIGHGLTLPLQDRTVIQLCIEIYQNWLSPLFFVKKSVPEPILQAPEVYAQQIFKHFYALFVPREKEPQFLEDHLTLCKRILDIIHRIGIETRISRETWDTILSLLLKVADDLLAPPTVTKSLGNSLCEQLVHTIFNLWLRASVHYFPTPSLWKSLRELCITWRHHPQVIAEWNKIMYSMTVRVVVQLYGPTNMPREVHDEHQDYSQSLALLKSDALVQCWYRMLHTLGNLVELSYPHVISLNPKFREAAILEQQSKDGRHDCLKLLPNIFHQAMKGVAALVDLFLSVNNHISDAGLSPSSNRTPSHPPKREVRLDSSSSSSKLKSSWSKTVHSVLPMSGGTPGVYTSPSSEGTRPQHALADVAAVASRSPVKSTISLPARPNGNTLLHLFGSWLFEATVWPDFWPAQERSGSMDKDDKGHSSSFTVITGSVDDPRITEATPTHRKASHAASLAAEFEPGRAKAFAALCRIFSAQPCANPFLPIYLARFCHAATIGLKYNEQRRGYMITSIILNSSNLLRNDIKGVNVLVPPLLSAIELILPLKELKFKFAIDQTHQTTLRRASINILLSMLPLPLHFLNTTIEDISSTITHSGKGSEEGKSALSKKKKHVTFYSLKRRILSLLLRSFEHETDAVNMQLLLCGLLMVLQDHVTYENASAQTEAASKDTADAEVTMITQQNDSISPVTSLTKMMNITSENYFPSTFKSQENLLLFSGKDTVDLSPPNLFKVANHIVCQCLHRWQTDLRVTLSALELSGSLAKVEIENADSKDRKQAVKWLCDYIKMQATKEQLHHSKDLHTMIVAAFNTILIWTKEKPSLLASKECLTAIMSVLELGISGSASTKDGGDTVVYKEDKKRQPVSGRVLEIAEHVLSNIMENVGSFPSPCGPEASSSLLTEENIIAQLPSSRKSDSTMCFVIKPIPISNIMGDVMFRYFVLDSSVIIGVLEEPFVDDDEALPTITMIIRSPTGRHVWTMRFCYYPRSVEINQQHLVSVDRPMPQPDVVMESPVEHKMWPEGMEDEPPVLADQSIPSLEDILDDESLKHHKQFVEQVEKQVELEQQVHEAQAITMSKLEYPNPSVACQPPGICRSYQTARLLLCHLGLINSEALKAPQPTSQPTFMMLNNKMPNFSALLASLDHLPSRYTDSVFMFYVKDGVTKVDDILTTQQQLLSSQPREFQRLLQGLGWTVDPAHHPGFKGKLHPVADEIPGNKPLVVQAQIPSTPFTYYTDSIHEVAFVTPVARSSAWSNSNSSVRSMDSSDSGGNIGPSLSRMPEAADPSLSLSGGLRSRPEQSETPARRRMHRPQDCAVIVAWLERYEDRLEFPIRELTASLHSPVSATSGYYSTLTKRCSDSHLPVVFIHPLSSGLYRVSTNISSSRHRYVGPLTDGMTVSQRVLPPLLRQTCLNICCRHRMETEGYSPPHVLRKKLIEEIALSYANPLDPSDFYTELFVHSI